MTLESAKAADLLSQAVLGSSAVMPSGGQSVSLPDLSALPGISAALNPYAPSGMVSFHSHICIPSSCADD